MGWLSVAKSPPLLIISPTTADVATPTKSFLSGKVAHFTESVIREMTRKAMMYDAVNLAQGIPDFPAPAEIKQAKCDHPLQNLPHEMCQESYQQQSADSADPEKEVGGQFRGIDFFFVHSKITSNADATLEWRIVREQ
jgi:hypothetical protein